MSNTDHTYNNVNSLLCDLEEQLDAVAQSNGIVPPLQPAYDLLQSIEKLVSQLCNDLAAARAQAENAFNRAQFTSAKLAAIQMLMNSPGV